jgi:heparin/heparan-sulfate lyase
MPGEKMPRYWGTLAPEETELPVPNDGGQRERLGSKVVAFESAPDFCYVAGDATSVYHKEKCELALRQFLFIPPDFFVVFDRVIARDPTFQKTWLLHTAEEPMLRDREFSATHEQGKLFCRTLLPEATSLSKVGGPGKQFWSDGRNWPLPQGYRVPDSHPLLGQWRVEIQPRDESVEHLFLHLIQVGDGSLGEMVPSELLRKKGQVGLRFGNLPRIWEVYFGTENAPSGSVRMIENGVEKMKRVFAGDVMPQTGLYPAMAEASTKRP